MRRIYHLFILCICWLCFSCQEKSLKSTFENPTLPERVEDMSLSDQGHASHQPDAGVTPIGDPEAGFRALVNNGYVSCGIPEALSAFVGLGDETDRIEGRNELNQDMPYFWTKHQAPSGVNLIVGNCLTCHASRFNGELVIGPLAER